MLMGKDHNIIIIDNAAAPGVCLLCFKSFLLCFQIFISSSFVIFIFSGYGLSQHFVRSLQRLGCGLQRPSGLIGVAQVPP